MICIYIYITEKGAILLLICLLKQNLNFNFDCSIGTTTWNIFWKSGWTLWQSLECVRDTRSQKGKKKNSRKNDVSVVLVCKFLVPVALTAGRSKVVGRTQLAASFFRLSAEQQVLVNTGLDSTYINDVAYISMQGLDGPINHSAHSNSPVCSSKRAGSGGDGKKSPPDPADKRGTKNRSDCTDFILLDETVGGWGGEGWMDGWMEALGGRREERRWREEKKVTSPANPGTLVGHMRWHWQTRAPHPAWHSVQMCLRAFGPHGKQLTEADLTSRVDSCLVLTSAGHERPNAARRTVRRRPADAYLAFFLLFFFLMKLTLNPWERQTLLQTHRHKPRGFPCCLIMYLSIYLSPFLSLFFFSSFCFYLDRKTPQVFLVGNSRRGMLLREQGAREESRFSGF